ncbi:MAG: AGE family epimerase/isomerase [Candidatus Thorarchaeota archaeon]|nr:AGE family epimerase/isomerase [Candidatus Thorarchaeota archaeon]
MGEFCQRWIISLIVIVLVLSPILYLRGVDTPPKQKESTIVKHSIASADTWSIQDYEDAIQNLFFVFNYFNLSSFGGGWQVEVWDNFTDYAWSVGKKAYFDAQCILGLTEAYSFTENESYLEYAEDIWNWDRSHFWDAVHGGYYERLAQDNSIEVGNKRLWFQCLTGTALAKLYSVTGNNIYLDYIEELYAFIVENYYDPSDGSYYTTLSSTLTVIEDMNDINDISWCIRFLLETFEISQNATYKERAIELINNYINYMYDENYGWFYNRVAANWTTIIKDSKGWFDNYRMLVDAYRILGNDTYLVYAQKTFDDILKANSSAGYLMEMNREWTSYVNNEVSGEKDPNTAIGYLWTGILLANDTILEEAYRFKSVIYNDLLDSVYGGIYMRKKADGTIHTWKQWLSQGLVLEMLAVFASFLTNPDNITPRIENTFHEPTLPFDTDIVTVRTNVRDLSGLLSVNITYKINDEFWISSTFKEVQDDLYEYTFNPLVAGSNVEYQVFAIDNSENHNTAIDDNKGANYSFYIRSNDWTGPGITNVIHYPSLPTVDDVVNINATIRDNSGVSSASLYYQVNNDGWHGFSMQYLFDDIFHIELCDFEVHDSIRYYISAQDDSLNHNTAINDNLGSYYTFSIYPEDTTPPTIQSITQVPENPTITDSIIIRANVTDDIEVTIVILSYMVHSNSDWVNITMTKAQGVWVAIIPPITNSSIVDYRIIAYDRAGNYVASSIQTFIVELHSTENTIEILISAIATVTASIIIVIGLVVIGKETRLRKQMY